MRQGVQPPAVRVLPEAVPGPPPGLEVISLAELRTRGSKSVAARPQRPAAHQLLTLDTGTLRPIVDFTGHLLEPGAWLWVRPGQVQQVGDLAGADGTLVLFDPGFPDPATAAAVRLDDPFAPALRRPAADERSVLARAVGHLADEFHAERPLPPEVRVLVLRHLLSALLLRLAHVTDPAAAAPGEPGEAFRRFRRALEQDFTRTRRVEDYAKLLGYSPRTLSRATLAGAGIGAKEFIDRRVILEAKRLLAHGDRSAARIADHLGFADAANFAKYFHQRTGTTPIAFRAAVRAPSDESCPLGS